MEEICPCIK
jgi:hypothetical protein